MKSNSNTHRFLKIIGSIVVICLVLTMLLHRTSNMLKYHVFTNPNDLENWDDHIQIAVLLKGKQ